MKMSKSYRNDDKESKKKFHCEFLDCDRSYTTAGNLKSHVKMHKGELSYKCTETTCNKSFLTSYALRLHERGVHTNEKPYVCQTNKCEKRYNTLYRLKSHLRIHNGEMFECEKCGKKFTSKSDLRKHFRIHSGEKPFKCEIDNCKSAFTASHHLKNHFKTHQTKPFKCKLSDCDKKFKNPSNLKSHLKQHSKSASMENIEMGTSEEISQNKKIFKSEDQNNLSELTNLNNILPEDLLQNQNMINQQQRPPNQINQAFNFNNTVNQATFNASNGMMQFNLESAIPVNTLNNKNLYGLLFTTQRNDQLQLTNNDSLKNHAYTNEKNQQEINLPNQNETRSICSRADHVKEGPEKEINHYRIECDELCCLLKFTPLDT